MSRRTRRIGLIVLGLLLGGWILSGAAAAWFLSRRPRPQFAESVPKALVGIESVRLTTTDGLQLGAWYAPPSPGRPVVVLLHGINDSRTGFAGMMQSLQSKGIGSIAVSQRAHGDSAGAHCDVGWSGRHDVDAAVTFLEKASAGHPIVIFGSSMGSAAAIFAAKQLDHRVAGYILQSPYKDLDVAVRVRIEERVPFPLDVFALSALRLWAPLFVHERLAVISPAAHLRDIPSDIPVVLFAGGRDHLAPLSDIEAMAHEAGPHVRLVVFPDAGHVNMAGRDAARFDSELERLLAEISVRRAAPSH